MVFNVEFYELSIETGMEEYIPLGPLQMVVQMVQGATCVTGLVKQPMVTIFLASDLPTSTGFRDFNPMRILRPTVSIMFNVLAQICYNLQHICDVRSLVSFPVQEYGQ